MSDIFTVEHLKILGPWMFLVLVLVREFFQYWQKRTEAHEQQESGRDQTQVSLIRQLIDRAHEDSKRTFSALQAVLTDSNNRDARLSQIDSKIDHLSATVTQWENKFDDLSRKVESTLKS